MTEFLSLWPSRDISSAEPSVAIDVDDKQLESFVRAQAVHNARLRAARDLIFESRRLEEELAEAGLNVGRQSELIIAEVALKHGIRSGDIKGPSRERWAAWPRQEAMWRLRQVRMADGSHRWSTIQIGQMLGGRDHTSVIHGLRAFEGRSVSDGPRP